MNTINKITEKSTYFPPVVEKIKLDNEISLALESNPPEGPGETTFNSMEYFINNPYQNFG